jgi:hypothetical protein
MSYERNKAARKAENERRLMGESLKAFHARENARPPTLAEIYRTHPRARCPWTSDFINEEYQPQKFDPFTK